MPNSAKKLEIRSAPAVEFRFVEAADGKPPRIEGYAAVFNAPSEDLGGFTETVAPGAFKRSLAGGADVRLLINHDGLPLARTKSGTLKLAEDSRGLKFTAELDPADPDVVTLVPKMKRGDLNQCSFAFTTREDKWSTRDGKQYRELRDVDVSDVSIVTYPAYPQTSAAMRSLLRFRNGLPAEQRASITVDDNSLIYFCRYALSDCRDAFDSLNYVLDVVAGVTGKLSDRDLEAGEDLVSVLVDLIAKGRRTKATLQELGAEDETDAGTDDDQPLRAKPMSEQEQREFKQAWEHELAKARLAIVEAE